MPLTAQPAGSAEPYVLSASLDNARHLSSLLRAVHFQDHATCFATDNGLRVTVEDAKCIQANAFIQVGCCRRCGAERLRTPPETVGSHHPCFIVEEKRGNSADRHIRLVNALRIGIALGPVFESMYDTGDVSEKNEERFIVAEIFQEFAVQEQTVTFRINLSVLLDCLTIFGTSSLPGTSTALKMCYRGYGYPLMLFLEEGGVVTVCKINTEEPEDLLDFDFCNTKVVNKIILQSEGLREAFVELDLTSEVVQITMSPDKPYFRLSTFGNAGSAHLDYSKDSDLMEVFHCNQTQTNRYKISLLKPSAKALSLSCKVSIRTDAQGFLSLQYMIRNEDGQICFVEYYCCPDENITEEM